MHSESEGLTVRDDVIYGATPASSPFFGTASPPLAADLTYSAGWDAAGTGRAKTPAYVERDVAWVAHLQLHPADRPRSPPAPPRCASVTPPSRSLRRPPQALSGSWVEGHPGVASEVGVIPCAPPPSTCAGRPRTSPARAAPGRPAPCRPRPHLAPTGTEQPAAGGGRQVIVADFALDHHTDLANTDRLIDRTTGITWEVDTAIPGSGSASTT